MLAAALGLGADDRRALEAAAGRRLGPSAVRPARPGLMHNLPAPTTSFIGRVGELAEVRRLLGITRLLTLTGVGGVGKTRLALEAASALADAAPDGIWLVELAALSEPTLVPQAVASALDVDEQPGRTLTATLIDYLKPRQVLLLLDNCEHLVGACAQLAETLLRSCPDLKILATGREPLHIAGEVTWLVPSLAMADPQRVTALDDALRYDAIRLFVERARAVVPTDEVTDPDAAVLADVCYRLDGIPLAIELAAARVKVLSVQELAGRLDDRFRLLIGGTRTALTRQQTLKATLDWSHQLLSEPERVLFRRLAVFPASFTLEAAEAVGSGDGVDTSAVLDLLDRLVDKSLVQVVAGGPGRETRYRLLETVRQYGLEQLAGGGELAFAQRRHAAYYLAGAEEAEPELQGPNQAVWLDGLEREHDNLRAALDWCLGSDGEAGLRLGAALSLFWQVRGYLVEGRRRLEALLATAPERTVWRAKALHAAGQLARHQADIARGTSLCEASLALYRECGDTWGSASVLRTLGLLVSDSGDPVRGRALFEESLALSRETGDDQGIARTLGTLGCLALVEADYRRAHACLEESLALFQRLGDQRSIAVTLGNLAHLAWEEGDYAWASRLFEDKWALAGAIDNKRDRAYTLAWLGNLARSQGDDRRAHALLAESLRLHGEIGDKLGLAYCLCFQGVVEVHQGASALGLQLMSAASSLHKPLEVQLTPHERADRDAALAAAWAALGEEAFARAWDEGQALTLEQAIDEALAVASGGPMTAAQRASSTE